METFYSSQCHQVFQKLWDERKMTASELVRRINLGLEEGLRATNTPLSRAITQEDLSKIQNLLDGGEDVNGGKILPLFQASYSNLEDIARVLITFGADINRYSCVDTPPNGKSLNMTALDIASFRGNLKLIRFLIDEGAEIKDSIPLYFATLNGKRSAAELLLSRKLPLHVQSHSSPLHAAVFRNSIKLVRLLIQHGINVNAMSQPMPQNFLSSNEESESLITVLHLVVLYRNMDLVNVLLNAGGDINVQCSIGTPLHLACLVGKVDIVHKFLSSGADVNLKSADGFTPLHVASFGTSIHHTRVVGVLLSGGAAVNSKCNEGYTALHFATMMGNFDMVSLLIKSGTNIDSRDFKGFTALHTAAEKGNSDMVQLLLDNQADCNMTSFINGSQALHYAAVGGHLEVVKQLCDHVALIDPLDQYKRTPLIYCSNKGYREIVTLLLNKGALVNTTDIEGLTPLHHAVLNNQKEIIEILLRNGADINFKVCGLTSINLAIHKRKEEFVKVLLENGAFFDHDCDKTRLNSFFSRLGLNVPYGGVQMSKLITLTLKVFKAILNNDEVELKSCIEKGAIINCRSVKWGTPLILASGCGFENIVYLLLEFKAQVDLCNGSTGATALHYAAKFNHLNILKLLLRSGAQFNICTLRTKKTALEVAEKLKHKDIVDFLKKIDMFFRDHRNGKIDIIPILEKMKQDNFNDYEAIVKCRSVTGETLLDSCEKP